MTSVNNADELIKIQEFIKTSLESEPSTQQKFLNQSLNDFNNNMSLSVIYIFKNILNKPNNVNWLSHIYSVLSYNNNFIYIGTLFILLYILLSIFTN